MADLRNKVHEVTSVTYSILLEVSGSLNAEVLHKGVGQLCVRSLCGVRQGALHFSEQTESEAGKIVLGSITNRSGTNQVPSPKHNAGSVNFTYPMQERFMRTASLSSPCFAFTNEIRARHLTASGGIEGFSWSTDRALTRPKHSHSDL